MKDDTKTTIKHTCSIENGANKGGVVVVSANETEGGGGKGEREGMEGQDRGGCAGAAVVCAAQIVLLVCGAACIHSVGHRAAHWVGEHMDGIRCALHQTRNMKQYQWRNKMKENKW